MSYDDAKSTPSGTPGQSRSRDLWLLLTGSFVSILGNRLTTTALPLVILAMTRSPVEAGWACFAATAPSVLFYLPAGALVDRCNSRLTMIVCECLRGLITAAVVAALALWHPAIAQLVAAIVVKEILGVFSALAEQRFARSLVDPDSDASALAKIELRTHIAIMAGRPLGALLYGFSHALPFFADLISFGVNVTILLGLEEPAKRVAEEAPENNLIHEIREGFQWILRHHFSRGALPLAAGTTLISQALIMVFLGGAYRHHSSAFSIGMVLAVSGLGGALGSAMAPRLFLYFKYQLFELQLSGWLVTFACLVLSGVPSPSDVATAMFVLGFTGALGNIAIDTYIARCARREILGRVMSINSLLAFVSLALGPLAGGILLKEIGARDAIITLFIAVVLLRTLAPRAPRPGTCELGEPSERGYEPT